MDIYVNVTHIEIKEVCVSIWWVKSYFHDFTKHHYGWDGFFVETIG